MEQNELIIDLDMPKPMAIHRHMSLAEIGSKVYSTIDTFRELQENLPLTGLSRSYDFLFRGHSRSDYKLLSTAARCGSVDEEKEKRILQDFIRVAQLEGCEKYRLSGFNEDLFYMSMARHLGLHCRMLDWTKNLWKALSFMVYEDENVDVDGTLWIMAVPRSVEYERRSPLSINDDKLHILQEDYYVPDDESIGDLPLGQQRCFRQNGVFTVTSTQLSNIELNKLSPASLCGIEFIKINIPFEVKSMLRKADEITSFDELYTILSSSLIKVIQDLNNQCDSRII